jgi:hypothetical protein
MNLQTECLKRIPFSAATVQGMCDVATCHPAAALLANFRMLCLSHERLRAELEGAKKMLADCDGSGKRGEPR